VEVIARGIGSPGGTETVIVWAIERGRSRWRANTTSSQMTPMLELGTLVVAWVGPDSNDIEARSAGPRRISTVRARARSRTVSEVTVNRHRGYR
jgi:hypothetical protein